MSSEKKSKFQRKKKSISSQIKEHLSSPSKKEAKTVKTVSTGSTLLDLAISGGVYERGGVPVGILVEIFGPSGSGKTVLLSEMAGNVKRMNGDVMFFDPESRLNHQFARLFGLDTSQISYSKPNTVTEVFEEIRKWEVSEGKINGVFTDSLAALSTEMEMEDDKGDKMGMRRAKEFSEQLRKTCRILPQKNILMVCSNQIRQNLDGGLYGQKYVSPGGEAIAFYCSVRLRTFNPKKIKQVVVFNGRKEIERVVGVEVEVEVFKNSVWSPYRTANLTILFDYGIDDIRENLKFLKQNLRTTTYQIGDIKLSNSLEEAIKIVEEERYEEVLRGKVIEVWNEIESQFKSERKPKRTT